MYVCMYVCVCTDVCRVMIKFKILHPCCVTLERNVLQINKRVFKIEK